MRCRSLWSATSSVAILGMLLWSPYARAGSRAEYFPIREGTDFVHWSGTTLLASDFNGRRFINGVNAYVFNTTAILNDDPIPVDLFYSNAGGDVLLHGESGRFLGVTATLTFSPPIVAISGMAAAGQNTTRVGTLTIRAGGMDFPLDYSATSRIVGNETVTVPFGRFDAALRVAFELSVDGTINNQPVVFQGTETQWYAVGVGLVKVSGSASPLGATSAGELSDFSTDGADLAARFDAFTPPPGCATANDVVSARFDAAIANMDPLYSTFEGVAARIELLGPAAASSAGAFAAGAPLPIACGFDSDHLGPSESDSCDVTAAELRCDVAAGAYRLRVCADPSDVLDEANEANNCAQSAAFVLPEPAGGWLQLAAAVTLLGLARRSRANRT